MTRRNGTTARSGVYDGSPAPGGALGLDDRPHIRAERVGALRTAGAVGRLVRNRRRLEHWPTLGQVQAMARLEGREPCSYLLDPQVNFVPELLVGYEGELGRHALCFTAQLPHGVSEFVALSDGGGFALD
jgi:hypothetical protein